MSLKNIISILAFFLACFCAVAGFYVPPTGEISSSVLYLVAQLLVFISGFLGVNLELNIFGYQLSTKSKIKTDKDKEEDKEEALNN